MIFLRLTIFLDFSRLFLNFLDIKRSKKRGKNLVKDWCDDNVVALPRGSTPPSQLGWRRPTPAPTWRVGKAERGLSGLEHSGPEYRDRGRRLGLLGGHKYNMRPSL